MPSPCVPLSAGLRVLAFPCNQFGAQEPWTIDDIASHVRQTYDVQFEIFDKVKCRSHPLTRKVDVNGQNAHPLFKWLKKQVGLQDITWNFQ